MPKGKSKPDVSKASIQFDPIKTDPAKLVEFAKEEEDRYGIFPAEDGSGVTFGRSLYYGEHSGEGLPELGNDRQLLTEFSVNYVVRVTCDREGTTYLEVLQEGHQSFFSFPFKGIKYTDLFSIVPNFEHRLSHYIICNGMYPLFWALYRAKGPGKKDRSRAYDKITANFETFFKNLLKPKRERAIETTERDGMTITSYERIESGREPKSEAELEQEKGKFISDVLAALKRIDSEGGKRTQLDVGLIVFEEKDSEDVQSLMKNRCRLYGLKWTDILNEYDAKSVKN